eukprot:6463258-Amphidinium_carterae.2
MAVKRKLRLHVSRVKLLLEGQPVEDERIVSRATPAFVYQIVARSSSTLCTPDRDLKCSADSECIGAAASISPTIPGTPRTDVESQAMTQCRPDGSYAECPGSAGEEARLHLGRLADSVHCWQQAQHSLLAFHAANSRIFSSCGRERDTTVDQAILHEVLVQHGLEQCVFYVQSSELGLSLSEWLKKVTGFARFECVVNGLIFDGSTSLGELLQLGSASVRIVACICRYTSLTGRTRGSLSTAWSCDKSELVSLLGPGRWGKVAGDGACFWHALGKLMSKDGFELKAGVMSAVSSIAGILADMAGGTTAGWEDIIRTHDSSITHWADSRIAMCASMLLGLNLWIWEPHGTITKFGSYASWWPIMLMKCECDHFSPWEGLCSDLDIHFRKRAPGGEVNSSLTLCGGGAPTNGKGWRARIKETLNESTEEQRNPHKAINSAKTLGLHGLVQPKHWPMLLAVEPYLAVLLNTSSDISKLRSEIERAVKRRDLPPCSSTDNPSLPNNHSNDAATASSEGTSTSAVAQSTPGSNPWSEYAGSMPKDGKDKPGWKPVKVAATTPSYRLNASEWDTKTTDLFVKGEDMVMMIETVEELKELAKKAAESTGKVAAVTPFATEANGLVGTRLVFGYTKREGSVESTGTLPGFLYQLGGGIVKHLGTEITIESKVTAAATTIVQALLPMDCFDTDAWANIQRGDIIQFKKQVEEQLAYKLRGNVIDIFKLSRVGDVAATALMRVKTSAAAELIASSGISSSLFVSPIGEERKAYSILWLRREEASSLSKAVELAKNNQQACGLVWKPNGYGIRLPPSACAAEKQKLGRPSGTLWQVSGIPYDADDSALLDLLDSLSWKTQVVAGSRRSRGGAATWRVRADSTPPCTSRSAKWKSYEFILRIAAVESKSHDTIMQWQTARSRSSSTQPSSWRQLSRMAPWTPEKSPWEVKNEPSSGGSLSASARARSTPVSKRTLEGTAPPMKRRGSVSFADEHGDRLQKHDPWAKSCPRWDLCDQDQEAEEIEMDESYDSSGIAHVDQKVDLHAQQVNDRFGTLEHMVSEMMVQLQHLAAHAHNQNALLQQQQQQQQFVQQQYMAPADSLQNGTPAEVSPASEVPQDV